MRSTRLLGFSISFGILFMSLGCRHLPITQPSPSPANDFNRAATSSTRSKDAYVPLSDPSEFAILDPAAIHGPQGTTPSPLRKPASEGGFRDERDIGALREKWRFWLYGGAPDDAHRTRLAELSESLQAGWGALPLQKAPTAAASATWTHLGPFEFQSYGDGSSAGWDLNKGGGRVTAILTHPTNPRLVYISGPGGVYRCINADPDSPSPWSWELITPSLYRGAGMLAMDPDNPERLYYAPYSEASVYWTGDGGQTWAKSNGVGSTRYLLPLGGGVVLAGEWSVSRSTDGGRNFQLINPGPGGIVGGIGLCRLADGTVLGTNNDVNGGVYLYSTNQGQTWTRATVTIPPPGNKFCLWLAASAGNPAIAYGVGDFQGVMKTTDSGHTWAYVAPISTQGNDPTWKSPDLLVVDPSDPNRVFVGGFHLFRSMDGGQNWTQMGSWVGSQFPYLHADQHAAAFSKTGSLVLFTGNDGGITVTRDPYQTITPVAGAYPRTLIPHDNRHNLGRGDVMIYKFGSSQATDLAGTQGSVVMGLQDHGSVLRPAAGTGGTRDLVIGTGDGMGSLIHRVHGANMLTSGYGDLILKSTNGGLNWTNGSTGIDTAGASFFTTLVQGTEPDTVWHTDPKRLYRSATFGSSWQEVPLPGIDLSDQQDIRNVGTSPGNGQAVAIATGSIYGWYATSPKPPGYVSYNSGATWQPFGTLPGAASTPAPYALQFHPTNDHILYLSSMSYVANASHVWKSTDGGQSWNALDSPTSGFPRGVPVQALRIDTSNGQMVYAGTFVGVYRSADGGGTWQRLGDNFPTSEVTDLYLAPDSSFLRVSTYGAGLWEIALAALPDAPTITQQPQSEAAIAGQTVVFNVVVSGTGPLSYQWRKNSVDIPGASSSTLSFVAKLADSAALFSVSVANAGGTVLSADAALTVVPKNRDLNGDAQVNVLDLATLMAAYSGSGIAAANPAADLDGDGDCDDSDLAVLLAGI